MFCYTFKNKVVKFQAVFITESDTDFSSTILVILTWTVLQDMVWMRSSSEILVNEDIF